MRKTPNQALTSKPYGTRIEAMTDFTDNNAFERIKKRAKLAEKMLADEKDKKKTHLSNMKHPQADFFIADIFDTVTYRDDLASMEYPLFALKAGDTKIREYHHDGINITIKPTADGIATIHDKDIWIYCISKMCQAIYEGKKASKTVRFTIYDYLKSTNRGVSGEYYKKAKESLDRLKGTSIKVESENKKERIARGFGLLEEWVVVEEKDGRMIRVEVTLPEWLYRSVLSHQVLSLSPDYFRLRKPLDRRIYELARKHCGHQASFKISLDLLRKKSGTTAVLREFKRAIKSLAESNDLPDYSVSYDDKKDMVIFSNRNLKNLIKGLVHGIS